MIALLVGLLIFLGVHSARIVADDRRTSFIDNHGENAWKGLYAVCSLVGLALLIWGYGQARVDAAWLWYPPVAMRHVASVLMLVAFVFLAAAYVPGNHIKARVQHPMVLGVKTWALAHLLANGSWPGVVLFGAFLVWAVFDFISSKRRDRAAVAAGRELNASVAPTGARTGITVVVGIVAWVVFAAFLHTRLIGVSPFG